MKVTPFALIVALLMTISTNAFARIVTLKRDTPIYEIDRYGDIEELGTFLAGTQIEIFPGREKMRGLGSVALVRSVLDPHRIHSDYRHQVAMRINRSSDYVDFLVSEADLEGRSLRRNRDVRRRANPVVRRDPIRRDVVVRDFNEYQVCYETPRSRVVTMNEAQRDRGTRNIIGGTGAIIGGQIIGGLIGNDRVGDVISAIGLGFAAVGAVQVASAKEVFYTEYGVDCRSYYKADRRVYPFKRGRQSCETTRYYTSRWGQTTEYFETECRRGAHTSYYVSFERNTEIYGY